MFETKRPPLPPNSRLLSSLLSQPTTPSQLLQIHAILITTASHRHSPSLTTKLLNALSNLTLVAHAHSLFDRIIQPTTPLYNSILKLQTHHAFFSKTLEFYKKMRSCGVSPDGSTFSCVLHACGKLSNLRFARVVHGHVLRFGFGRNLFVANGVLGMYAKCRTVRVAKLVLDGMEVRNVVSWGSVVSGFVQCGLPEEALGVFREMGVSGEGVRPDFVLLVSVLKACADVKGVGSGMCVHGYVVKLGLESELDLRITLTAMYAKFGQVVVAKTLFEEMSSPSVILWNAMISGYAKNGHASEAVELFRRMVGRGISPDSISLRSAILACSQVGSLEMANWMEKYASNSEFKGDVFVSTALIDMYSKCGDMESARRLFELMKDRDTVAWSAIIVGYGLNSLGLEAIDLFNQMKCAGVRPNDVTFLGLLLACSHSGLVEEGRQYFDAMKDCGIEPSHQHYACLVDLLSRAGLVTEAYSFIMKMPMEPTVSVWGALLNACKIYGHVELGAYAAERVFALDPSNAGHYVQLSNLYASAGMWKDAARVRVAMKKQGVTKSIGSSLIEINGKLQAFRVDDKSHPESAEIFAMLDELNVKLKKAGFSFDIKSVFHKAGNEELDGFMCDHGERLAIAFGLISTSPGATLRITKNLRACVTCHSATKLISKIVEREIIIRDANRFHHFKNGQCSCGDHW